MQPIEIVVIVIALSIVLAVFGTRIYKRIKHLPVDECAECHKRMKKAICKMKKQYKLKTKAVE